jgi:aminodeoxyfutalosine deaminase
LFEEVDLMTTPDVQAFVAALPKVELHLHLIGSASPEVVLTLARRHPDGGVPTDAEELHRFYTFTVSRTSSRCTCG